MHIEIVQLDGHRNGPRRIAQRLAAERARVRSFNQNMRSAGMTHRTAMWRGIVSRRDVRLALWQA